METVTYGAFSQELHQKIYANRVPSEAAIEITRRCPLTCSHCYNNLPMNDTEARRSELTYEEHCDLLDQLADAGCLWLLFTGGEIFARRDFLDIYTYAKRKGFLITLFTNGTLITEKIADYLADWPPFAIEITLYGRTRETYERLTGVPGSYDKCIRGIKLLKERGLPLKLKSVAVTVNAHEIWGMKQFAHEELGVDFKFDAMMSPRIDCGRSPLAVRLTPEEVVDLDLQDPDRVSEWKRFAKQFNGPTHKLAESDDVYHCGGGINSFAVDPQGKMSICVLSHMDTYDLREGSVREGWDDFLFKVRTRKSVMLTKCRHCEMKALCGMCPANGELESGEAEKPVEFLCNVAHLRGQLMDFPAPPHGDCEFCEGGEKYDDLISSAARLRKRDRERAGTLETRNRYLPVLTESASAGAGCSSGGCGH